MPTISGRRYSRPPLYQNGRRDPLWRNISEPSSSCLLYTSYNGGGFTDEVTLKDEMLLLEETQINDTFLDTTPQEMISYFLGRLASQR